MKLKMIIFFILTVLSMKYNHLIYCDAHNKVPEDIIGYYGRLEPVNEEFENKIIANESYVVRYYFEYN